MDKQLLKYYTDFGITPQKPKLLKKQLVHNLYVLPKKDKGVNMPHFQKYDPDAVHQADLLFLPHDEGYKYALVVVDVGTRKTDTMPLKSKSSEAGRRKPATDRM